MMAFIIFLLTEPQFFEDFLASAQQGPGADAQFGDHVGQFVC